MSYKLLKQAADQLDKLATELEASEKQLAQTKVAAAQPAPSAQALADEKAKLLSHAKVAADKLLDAGLLGSVEKRDQFAAQIVDHKTAIEQLGKLASAAQMPRMGRVVVDGETHLKTASSADTWDTAARAALARLNLK